MPSTLMLLANPYRPDPRVRMEAKMLTDSGMRVTILSWSRDTGEQSRESLEGIDVVRVGPRCAFRSATGVVSKLPRYWLAALRAASKVDFDLVHSHDLDTLPLGLALSAMWGKPLLYDSHELYSAMVKDDIGPLYLPVALFERLVTRCPDAVITVNETLAKNLSRGSNRIVRIVTTSQDVTAARNSDTASVRERYGLEGFVVSYLGSLEPGRFVEEIVDSFGPEDGVTVLIAGRGSLEKSVEKAAGGRPHVRFVGSVDADEALRLMAASDLVSAMMDPSNPNNVVGTPGKVLSAMALERPIVTAEGLDIGKLVKNAGCGLVVPYGPTAFREAVMTAKIVPETLKHMGSKGKEYYDAHLSWERSRDELLAAYENLLGART